MRGDAGTIKERLNIAEVVSGYVKLEKAGSSFKARCPFHNEKTPSFFVSPLRQSFYCFGCSAKGDIFSFVEQVEGLDFRGALRLLAEKAGVELIQYHGSVSKTEKDKVLNTLEEATTLFEKGLTESKPAQNYIASRGISNETVKNWRIGYAPAEWRALYGRMKNLGYDDSLLLKAGLIKEAQYDVFRDRIIFPLADTNSHIIAFSGRALSKNTEPKYLNSPDTVLFTKSEVLYGLDKAKVEIRKKNYAILVEGQIDLVLSHQTGLKNTVASSGTAFTRAHFERLRHLSSRVIIAFDGDSAGEAAAEKAGILGISLGFEVKVASLPSGLDPAEVAKRSPQHWKEIIRQSLPVVEFFLNKILEREKDQRKVGKQIEKKILPMIKLIGSAIEQSHFVSLIAGRAGIKESVIWEDLKKVKASQIVDARLPQEEATRPLAEVSVRSRRKQIEERLSEIKLWREELQDSDPGVVDLKKEEDELADNLSEIILREKLDGLLLELSEKEKSKDDQSIKGLAAKIKELHNEMRTLEEKRKTL